MHTHTHKQPHAYTYKQTATCIHIRTYAYTHSTKKTFACAPKKNVIHYVLLRALVRTHAYIYDRKSRKEVERHELRLKKHRESIAEMKKHKPQRWDQEIVDSEDKDSETEVNSADGEASLQTDSDSERNDQFREYLGTSQQLYREHATASEVKFKAKRHKGKKLSWEEELDLAEKLGGPVPDYRDFSEEHRDDDSNNDDDDDDDDDDTPSGVSGDGDGDGDGDGKHTLRDTHTKDTSRSKSAGINDNDLKNGPHSSKKNDLTGSWKGVKKSEKADGLGVDGSKRGLRVSERDAVRRDSGVDGDPESGGKDGGWASMAGKGIVESDGGKSFAAEVKRQQRETEIEKVCGCVGVWSNFLASYHVCVCRVFVHLTIYMSTCM
jgi:hypothetical protein